MNDWTTGWSSGKGSDVGIVRRFETLIFLTIWVCSVLGLSFKDRPHSFQALIFVVFPFFA